MDRGWFEITSGLPPYERFRYIARHALRRAVAEAASYAADERIFGSVRGTAGGLASHLRDLDVAMFEDATVTRLERLFFEASLAEACQRAVAPEDCLAAFLRAGNGDGAQE